MARVFNLGIGMVLVVAATAARRRRRPGRRRLPGGRSSGTVVRGERAGP